MHISTSPTYCAEGSSSDAQVEYAAVVSRVVREVRADAQVEVHDLHAATPEPTLDDLVGAVRLPAGAGEHLGSPLELGRVGPVLVHVGEGVGRTQVVPVVREERRRERLGAVRVHGASAAERRHHHAAVVAHDPEVPEVVAQVGVVAEPEERLGILGDHVGVEVLEDLDLVVAADAGQDRLDLGICKRGVDVPGSVPRARPDPSGRVLDRLDAVVVLKPRDPRVHPAPGTSGEGRRPGRARRLCHRVSACRDRSSCP